MASGDGGVSPGAVTAAAIPLALYNPAVRNALVTAITKRLTWQAMLLTRCGNTCLLLAVLWLWSESVGFSRQSL